MQQDRKKFIKYGAILSFLNVIVITSVLVLYDLYSGDKPNNTRVEKPLEGVKKKLVKKKPPIKKPTSKKKKPYFDTKKRTVIKKICIVNIHKPECRKPDVTSMPAALKDYYNYDPINKVWVWSGGR